MTDETFDFVSDTSEKAKTARSAHFKNGRSSAKTFNNYTEKQCKEKNGPTLIFNTPVSFNVLKSFPASVQKDYILDLAERYSVSSGDLSSMFGIRVKELFAHLKDIGIESYPIYGSFDKDEWNLFLKTKTFPHKAISWSEFKALETDEIKSDYVKWVMKEFKLTTIAPFAKLFKVSEWSMYTYFKAHVNIDRKAGRPECMTPENVDRFNKFAGTEEAPAVENAASTQPEINSEPVAELKDPIVENTIRKCKIPASLNLTFYDETPINDIAEILKSILGDIVNGKIEIYINNK